MEPSSIALAQNWIVDYMAQHSRSYDEYGSRADSSVTQTAKDCFARIHYGRKSWPSEKIIEDFGNREGPVVIEELCDEEDISCTFLETWKTKFILILLYMPKLVTQK